jgi:hypothetical protein
MPDPCYAGRSVANCPSRFKASPSKLVALRIRRRLPRSLRPVLLLMFLLAGSFTARGQNGGFGPSAGSDTTSVGSKTEAERLRDELEVLRSQLDALRARLDSQNVHSEGALPPASESFSAPQSTTPQVPAEKQSEQPQGTPQSTGASYDANIAMATKAHGGDLSGTGDLLRTQRITLGGYGDFQFRQGSLNERDDGGGTPTFQSTRFVLGVAAVLSDKQNIVFNSEIEYELGTSEIDVEQAFAAWKVRPEFEFRGGIIVPALGRFNSFHDSNLNLLTLRPFMNQYIIPTAYRDPGMGIRGRFKLPHEMRLFYEADVLNGFQAHNADGISTPFSRFVGQSSAAEPGLVGFQDNNNNKAVSGRIGFSPLLGLEFGASVYGEKFNDLGTPPQSVTIAVVDGSYQHGPLIVNGEYARSNIVGAGIPRKSPTPPVCATSLDPSCSALAQFVAKTSPGQDGFYVEGAYKFFGGVFRNHERFDGGAYLAPVVRFETVRLDRTVPNFYLNRSRATLGLNIAPSPSIIFKLNYAVNHTFGPVPQVPGPVKHADFGNNPIPFLDYGKNGFVGCIAYVF